MDATRPRLNQRLGADDVGVVQVRQDLPLFPNLLGVASFRIFSENFSPPFHCLPLRLLTNFQNRSQLVECMPLP
jgi:hypothetical protein